MRRQSLSFGRSCDGWRYVHFSTLGFALLREGGGFGFIVSDTFFTLATKLRMRALLQRHRLTHLGQCDPFDATVDAAIFVARKNSAEFSGDADSADETGRGGVPPAVSRVSRKTSDVENAPHRDTPSASEPDSTRDGPRGTPGPAGGTPTLPTDTLLFIQARPRPGTAPDVALDTLPPRDDVIFSESTETMFGKVTHGTHARPGHTSTDLRVHRVPLALYRATHDRVFFEPRAENLALWQRFNGPLRALSDEWWERIAASDRFATNRGDILNYAKALKPGEVTLVGLIAEGGQGLATGNNFRFLGYLDGTPQAAELETRRAEWSRDWLNDPKVGPRFRELVKAAGGNPDKPTKDKAAWEASVELLCAEFGKARLGITRMDLCRIVPPALVAKGDDFDFAWQKRKAELLERWQTHEELRPFWHTTLDLSLARKQLEKLHQAKTVSDEDFVVLCREIQQWAAGPQVGKRRAPREAVGLRSGEDYTNAADAPRIATIYAGLRGRGRFVPYSKGDPHGSRWTSGEPLFIEWTNETVRWLFENSGKSAKGSPVVRNAHLYLTPSVSWSDTSNHAPLKARELPVSINDVKSMRLSPILSSIPPNAFLAILNSDVFSYWVKRFINNTCMYQVNDLRQAPMVIPTRAQAKRLETLAGLALRAKHHDLNGTHPDPALVAAVQPIEADLAAHGPKYLRPGAQQKLLATAADCLAILERAVSWETEKLYGVEALGPFDEF